jgi:hypothetical protein
MCVEKQTEVAHLEHGPQYSWVCCKHGWEGQEDMGREGRMSLRGARWTVSRGPRVEATWGGRTVQEKAEQGLTAITPQDPSLS